MPKVVVTDFITEPLDLEREIFGNHAEVSAIDAKVESDLEGKVEDADTIMMYHFLSIGEETLRRLKNCKLIVRCGVGFDNVDHATARQLGIPVANVPDYGTEEVADSAIGHLLGFFRGIFLLNSRLRRAEGPWSYEQAKPLTRVRGQKLGIIGLGRIGTATAIRAKALGLDVLFFDPYLPDGIDKSLGIKRIESLEEILASADAISLHCPLSDETHHLIDHSAVDQMKKGSYLVNTARGGIVAPEAALVGISSGKLSGVALDVLETEPPDEDSPLIQAWRDPEHPAHDRLVINPHAAFYSEQGLADMRTKGSENCLRAILGQTPRNIINQHPIV